MSDQPAKPDEVVLRFRPLPSAVPWSHRVRMLLKIALKSFRLRCIGVEGLPADEPAKQQEPNQ